MTRIVAKHADLLCLTTLLGAITLLVWNRHAFDIWIARHDNLTAYLPWYTYLGERLRAGEIPGWNPYQFSGAPFAADPQSGWMYLPAMLAFALFDPATAMWIKLAIELLVAGLTTYALIRLLGFSPVAALGGASLYALGPLSFQTAYCCTVRSHVAAWLPLSLLGAELAFRATSRPAQAAAIAVAGFGFSQALAGWLGQGSLNSALVIGAWCIYRGVTTRAAPETSTRRSLLRAVVKGGSIGLGIGLAGMLLNAAALLPRLVVNAETNLAGARYDQLPSGYNYPPYSVDGLLAALISDDYSQRRMTIPAAGLVLALAAIVIVPRARAVLFFAGLTLVTCLLALSASPLYDLFALIPRWQELHDHYPPQVTATLAMGPAVLAAAMLDALPRLAGHLRRWLVLIPLAALALTAAWLARDPETFSGLTAPLVIMATTAAVLIAVAGFRSLHLARAASVAAVALLMLEPMGLELLGSVSRWDPVPGWERTWSPQSELAAATDIYLSPDDPGGAGAFLQDKKAEIGPFRYAGYGGITFPGGTQSNRTYTSRRAEPEVLAMLVNGRSIVLHLYDMQGYNPVQLSRYTDYVHALNTVPQDYHLANLRPQGIGSPLLNALNVRFILVDARLPPDRADVVAISQGNPPVFETPYVRVYENPHALSSAWIVHEAIPVSRAEAISRLTARDLDPASTALVETSGPVLELPPAGSAETAQVIEYQPERITISASAASTGLLITSEIVESGWRAWLDGHEVPVLPIDIAFRGVVLPAGEHTIEFRYEPPALRIGLGLSLLAHATLILLLGVAVLRRSADQALPRSATLPATTVPSRA